MTLNNVPHFGIEKICNEIYMGNAGEMIARLKKKIQLHNTFTQVFKIEPHA